MKQEFSDVKINDKVWDLINGWGKVYYTYPKHFNVIFENNKLVKYIYDGRFDDCLGVNRSLFWDEIKIEAPPKPKKVVHHKFEYFAHSIEYMNEQREFSLYGMTQKYQSDKTNIKINGTGNVKITIEYDSYE